MKRTTNEIFLILNHLCNDLNADLLKAALDEKVTADEVDAMYTTQKILTEAICKMELKGALK